MKYLSQFSAEIFQDIAEIKTNKIQYVDFFAGCGGMSYGFHLASKISEKIKNVGAFDVDEHANKTYEKNLGTRPINIDLGSSSAKEITAHMKKNGYTEEDPIIVIGCAPCQGFSSHRKKDPRKDTRNSLVAKFAEIAVGLNADFIIMENVPDLLSDKHKRHYGQFEKTLKSAGYRINVKIVNMADYGVAQARFRTLVLASKEFTPPIPEPIVDRQNYYTVYDAIGHLPKLSAGEKCIIDGMHITSKHRPETINIIKEVPKDGGSRPRGVGPKCLDKVAGFYDVYGRLAWKKPSITITARCRTPSCGRFSHPEQDRGLSVREAALLQGFPPDFAFEGPFDDKFKQVGNAVPPIFSRILASHVLRIITTTDEMNDATVEKQRRFKSYSSIIAHVKSEKEISNEPN
jgi:DNA (cytosine-5)-methyltransferase 1